MTEAMVIRCSWMFRAAENARDSALAGRPFDAIVAVLLATVATEAFINELPELIAHNRDMPFLEGKIAPKFLVLSDVLQDLENNHAGLKAKYRVAALILGRPFDPGARPFQDFDELVSLRNELVHLKPRDKWIPGNNPESGHVEWPKCMAFLQSRGLAQKQPGPDVFMSWTLALRPAMAAWACETAEQVIKAILTEFPDDGPAGLVHAMHQAWR